MDIGDIRLSQTIDIKFTTIDSTGLASALTSGAVAAYPDNSTTQITAGITLSADFDSVTGLNNVRVVASSGNGYATATNYALVLTAGTVDSVSVAGYVVGHFSIENRSALMPTTAARTLDVSADGDAEANVTKWLGTAAATPTVAGVPEVDVTHWLGTAAATPTTAGVPEVDVTYVAGVAASSAADRTILLETTIASVTSQTILVLTDGSADDDAYNGCPVMIEDVSTAAQKATGLIVSDYAGASLTLTLEAAPVFTVAATDKLVVYPKNVAGGVRGTHVGNTTGNRTGNIVGTVSTVTAIANDGITTNSFLPGAITSSALASSALNVIADAVLDELLSGHTTAGTLGKAVSDVLADTAEIGAAGAGLTAVPWNAAWDAEVQSEAEDALVAHRLDELLNADSDIDGAAPPTVGSVFHELMTKTAGSFTYDQTTDSLEAVRDRGDAAWVTATGFSTHSAADVWAVGARTITSLDEDTVTLDLDATIRAAVGLASANLDTQLSTIDDFLDSEISAIKTVTDQFTAAQAEPSAVPAANATPLQKIAWIAALARNKITQTATTQTLRNDADDGTIAASTHSDDATTHIRGEWA
jgi:hypothetical protein